MLITSVVSAVLQNRQLERTQFLLTNWAISVFEYPIDLPILSATMERWLHFYFKDQPMKCQESGRDRREVAARPGLY